MTLFKNKITKSNINCILLVFIGLFFVFRVVLSTLFIIFLLLVSFKKSYGNYLAFTKNLFILFSFCFLLFVLAACYNTPTEFSFVYKTLGLLFIPLCFFKKELTKKEVFFFSFSFLISNLIYLLYFDALLLKYFFETDQLNGLQPFMSCAMPNRIYFTLNVLLAIVCLKFIFDYKKIKIVFLFGILIFIGFNLILIAARVALFTGFLLLLIILFENIKISLGYSLITLITLVFCVVFFGQNTKERLTSSSEDPRFGIWHCAYTIYKDTNFNIITGEFSNLKTDKKLIDCYNSKEVLASTYAYMKDYNFNSHNQFIWFFLCFGLVGLTLYLAFFGIHFLNFFHAKNVYSLFFILIFFIQSLFENILVRQQGIYVFAWFAFLFVAFGKKSKL
jgi:hypothetical protein